MYEGLLEEGLSIVKAARERHDGWRRNPWDEMECGHHYARAMSSWALFLALSGYSYSGPEMRLGFSPQLYPEDFRTFWTAGSGWGSYFQKAKDPKSLEVGLVVASGDMTFKEFSFSLPPSLQNKEVIGLRGSLAGKALKPRFSKKDNKIFVGWEKPVIMKAGDELLLEAQF